MSSPEASSDALAILIDADNANPAIVKGLIAEVAKLGRASVRRIYGDWTSDRLKSWKASLLEHSIQPIQQFGYTTGKNATDSAMIIDAMDLLYAGNLDGFCIVSSDSDFTRLASRLRESGRHVYGFGEKKTPRPFVAACDRFIYTEIFTQTEGKAPQRKASSELGRDRDLLQLVGNAVDAVSDDSGWANLGGVGSTLTKNEPDFDPRNYGYSKLRDLLEATKLFELERQGQVVRVRRIS